MKNLSKVFHFFLLSILIACSSGNSGTAQKTNSNENSSTQKTSSVKKIKLADLKDACTFLTEARVRSVFSLTADAKINKPENRLGTVYGCQTVFRAAPQAASISISGFDLNEGDIYDSSIKMQENGGDEQLSGIGEACFWSKGLSEGGEYYCLRLYTSGLQIDFTGIPYNTIEPETLKKYMAQLAKEWLAENT